MTEAQKTTLPPSLAASPNIPWAAQTLDQLRAEHAYWNDRVRTAPDFDNASAAGYFRLGCEAWIKRREMEPAI
jgi:hypothetical protein